MPNAVFQRIVRARVESALAQADALKGLDHRLTVGRLREILLENLLRPLAPPNLLLGTGIAMDHIGGQSGEIDVFIANQSNVPRISFGPRDAVFPIESIVYAIEIKSVFKKEHVDECLDKFKSFRALKSLPCGYISADHLNSIGGALNAGHIDADLYVYGPDRLVPPTVIFAYRSRTRMTDHLERLHQINLAHRAAIVQVICIPREGYWYWSRNTGWIATPPDENRLEMLNFLAGLTNTMFIAQSAYAGARFGQYLA